MICSALPLREVVPAACNILFACCWGGRNTCNRHPQGSEAAQTLRQHDGGAYGHPNPGQQAGYSRYAVSISMAVL